MALTEQQKAKLKPLYGRLRDEPLRTDVLEDVEMYEPIYKPTPDHDEPIELLATHIDYNPTESIQLFSGFRGSGKTTELLRLRQQLQKQGHIVLYANALDYINESAPIDISDLLITLAGAFSDALRDKAVLGEHLAVEPYWERLLSFFKTIKIDVSDMGIKAGVDIKLTLKATPSFRQRIQEKLANHIATLKTQVDRFIEEGVAQVWQYHGEGKKIIFILDSLEQMRGSLPTERAVMNSVQSLFGNHFDKLKLPYLHVIYTVPPWLRFVVPGLGRIEILPSIRMWNNDPPRTPFVAGVTSLNSLVRRRLRDDGIELLFGTDRALLQRLIDSCGGHLRDLIRLLQETMRRARALPVSRETVERAIVAVRSQYLPIAVEHALWLDRIATLRRTDLQSPEDIGLLMHFLDSHMVLFLANGSEWYDIHPLIREEVQAIVVSQKKAVEKAS